MNLSCHYFISLTIRLFLIIAGEVFDNFFQLHYTDIDYLVFTDAARHIIEGSSPYQRHTYRYSPIIAIILTPNIFIHHIWGKILFSVVDLFIAELIFKLVLIQKFNTQIAKLCALTWLYNPLAIIIATRGNADSIAAFLVLLTLFLVLKEKPNYVLAGFIHGISIHFRLYPIVFSLAMYLSLTEDEKNKSEKMLSCTERFRKYIAYTWPKKDHLVLVFSCIISLLSTTFLFYYLYGFKFIEESILYHLNRQDTRHNFSVYFYLLYLSTKVPLSPYFHVFTFLPQLILLIVFSFLLGRKKHLIFCWLVQAIVIVSYNPVLTSQYFIWFVSLFPPCLPKLNLRKYQVIILFSIWTTAQLGWLIPAYWLEFRGKNTFIYIWLQGIGFFCANIGLLGKIIYSYNCENGFDDEKKKN